MNEIEKSEVFASVDAVEKEAINDRDDALLLSIGKTAELKRVYSFWTLCAYQVQICATWTCIVVLYGTIFDLGGPAALIYGSIIVAIGQTLLMMSLAEYCRLWPTAGGQQFYIQVLASEKWRPILSYFVGWSLIIAQIATAASCSLNNANIFLTFAAIVHPEFEWKPYMTFLVYIPMIIIPLLMNLRPKLLPTLGTFGALLTIGGFIAWAVTFLVMAPKSDAKFVFTTFLNNSGYKSTGWVFIMSFYNPMYGLYGTDAMMHLVEEMKDAARDAPRVMMWSMIYAGLSTIAADLILLFCCGNYTLYQEALSPYVAWFMDITGSVYGGGLWISVMFGIYNIIISTGLLAACSRLAWRMAQDYAFPWSEWLATLHPELHIPLHTMYVVFTIEVVLGLIAIGSDLAFFALVSGAGVSFQLAYVIPVIATLCRGRSILPPRPNFDLGHWGYFVNYLSVAWALIVSVVYIMPLYLPVDNGDNIGNMNWACLILGVEILFAGTYWIFKARHRYLKEGFTKTTLLPALKNKKHELRKGGE